MKASLRIDPIKLKQELKKLLAKEGFSLIQKEDFPLDVESSVNLFQSICQIGKSANPHLAEQAGKIEEAIGNRKIDLKKLFEKGIEGKTIEQVADELGLDKKVFYFLVQASIKPSVEAAREQLHGELDSETWLKGYCPVCGSLPFLSLLKEAEGKRYLLCSFCGYQWRIDRISCPSAITKSRVLFSIFMVKERKRIGSTSATNATNTSRRSITETWLNRTRFLRISPPFILIFWPIKEAISDQSPTPGPYRIMT